VIAATLIPVGRAYLLLRGIAKGTDVMKAPTSEYRREAARLRGLIAEATTARAREHLEEQARLNEKLAIGSKSSMVPGASRALKKAA
jgi:hypothetical protein